MTWLISALKALLSFTSLFDSPAEDEDAPLDPEHFTPCPGMARMGLCPMLLRVSQHVVDGQGHYYHHRVDEVEAETA